jgi:hypothetical protein
MKGAVLWRIVPQSDGEKVGQLSGSSEGNGPWDNGSPGEQSKGDAWVDRTKIVLADTFTVDSNIVVA